MAKRRLALLSKVTLEGIAGNWGAECYAVVNAATVQEKIEFNRALESNPTDEQIIQHQMEFVKAHFVSGKLKVLTDAGEPELVDMEASDIEESLDISNRLFNEVSGLKFDPKGSEKVAGSVPEQANADSSTGTTSSTETSQ